MNFRRYYIPNSIIFITNVVYNREPIFANAVYLNLFRETLHNTKALHPFIMLAYVFLPDHMHLLLKPTGASDFSKIMQSAKSYFTYVYKQKLGMNGRMNFWQKRFYDHIIRDEEDLAHHIDYIHYNPVKHGYVTRPEDWQHSSFLTWQQKSAYPARWGWTLPDALAAFNPADAE